MAPMFKKHLVLTCAMLIVAWAQVGAGLGNAPFPCGPVGPCEDGECAVYLSIYEPLSRARVLNRVLCTKVTLMLRRCVVRSNLSHLRLIQLRRVAC